MERELNIIIHQVYQEKPSVKKRKGHFKKSRLLKLGRDSNCISLPSGGWKAPLQPAGTNLFFMYVLQGKKGYPA